VFAIAGMWQWIEDRPIESTTNTSTATSTTNVPQSTTTLIEDAVEATCKRSAEFVAEVGLMPVPAHSRVSPCRTGATSKTSCWIRYRTSCRH
jgi:hypothetical protein